MALNGQGAAQGAAAGSAFGPWGTAIGAGIGAFSGGGGAGGAGGAPFMSDPRNAAYGTTLDGAGWIVNIGGTQDATSSPVRTTSNGDGLPPSAMATGGPSNGVLLLGALGLVAIVLMTKKRRK